MWRSVLISKSSKYLLAFGPSLVFSGMFISVPSKLSSLGQYSKSQKTDLVFHTFSSGSGFFIFPGAGHSFHFFNNSSISAPLLLRGGPRCSVSPLNRSPRFLHGSFFSSHLRCPM